MLEIVGGYVALNDFIENRVRSMQTQLHDLNADLGSRKFELKDARGAKKLIGRKNDDNAELHEQEADKIEQIQGQIEKLKKAILEMKEGVRTVKSLETLQPCRLQTGVIVPLKYLIAFEKKIKGTSWDITLTHHSSGLIYKYANGDSKGAFTLNANAKLTNLLSDVSLPWLLTGDI